MTDAEHGGSPDPFTGYYARESLSESTHTRFRSTRDAILRVRRHFGLSCERLAVADIGCGAGTQAMIWARDGHVVSGIDINDKLVELARKRAAHEGLQIRFDVASAVKLPWAGGSMDVCLLPEVLEHVEDWRSCLSEGIRILKPDGLLYLSTTNRLCPIQQEFELPMYSWYPAWLKRRYVRLSVTTRRELVNHAEFPAVNWFDFYSLRSSPDLRRFTCLDRFDVAALAPHGRLGRFTLNLVRSTAPLRWLAHVATPYTAIFAVAALSGTGRR